MQSVGEELQPLGLVLDRVSCQHLHPSMTTKNQAITSCDQAPEERGHHQGLVVRYYIGQNWASSAVKAVEYPATQAGCGPLFHGLDTCGRLDA